MLFDARFRRELLLMSAFDPDEALNGTRDDDDEQDTETNIGGRRGGPAGAEGGTGGLPDGREGGPAGAEGGRSGPPRGRRGGPAGAEGGTGQDPSPRTDPGDDMASDPVSSDGQDSGDDMAGDFEDARRGPRSDPERAAARELAGQSMFIGTEDIRFVERDGRTVAVVGREGRERFVESRLGEAEARARIAARQRATPEGFEAEPAAGGLSADPTGLTESEAALRFRAEKAIEEAVGAQRASAAGVVGTTLRSAVAESTDLEAGEDFEVSITRDEDKLSADVTLTEEFRREEAGRQLERSLAQQFDVRLEADEDFTVVETETGGFTAELTEEGAATVATAPLTEAVAGVERRGTEMLTQTARSVGFEGDVRFDAPGEGPLLTAISEPDEPAGFQEISERAAAGEFITASEFAGAIEADLIDPFEESFREATEISDKAPIEAAGEAPRGRAGAAQRQEARRFTGAGRQPVAQAAQGLLRSPLLVTGGAKFLKSAAETGAVTSQAAVAGDTELLTEISQDVKQTATESAVLGATEVAKDPGAFAARGLGTLAGSALLFGGAAAVGGRASLATRAVIQPGEEIAGIGGFHLTRRIAGERRAQQLFPGKEPLIFSEEAALRRARQTSVRARETLAQGRELLSRVELEPRRGFGAGPQPPRLRIRGARERRQAAEERTVRPGGLMGDPETFPVRELREQTKMRREQDARVTETAGELERLRVAKEPRVGQVESDLEQQRRRRFESAFASDVTAGAVDMMADTRADLLGDLRQESDTDVDIDAEIDTELVQELEVEAEPELRAEADAEAELELELELEGESEFEVEPLGLPRQRRRRRRDDILGDEFEKTFTTPVATPEEVLSGLSEDVLDDS